MTTGRVRRGLMRTGILSLAALMLWAVNAPARADDVADFYKGKTVNIYIGYPVGGTYDLYGRLAARHLGQHIPGHPNVVAQNMPGAGSVKAGNFMYAVAPKDGTALAVIADTAATEQLLGDPGIQFVTAKFNWIGRISSSLNVLAVRAGAKAKTAQDFFKDQTIVGGTGPTAPSVAYPRVLNALLDTKFKVVTGYVGSSDSCLAVERGEIDGCTPGWVMVKSIKQNWLKDKSVNVLLQWSNERHPDLPNTPTMVELGKTAQDKAVIALYASATDLGRALLAPPNVPEARVKALRTAFMDMIKDKDFIADLNKAHMDLDPLSGEALQKLIEKVSDVKPDVLEKARAIRAQNK